VELVGFRISLDFKQSFETRKKIPYLMLISPAVYLPKAQAYL